MSPHDVFPVVTYGVVPAWVLLAALPHWRWTQRIVHAVWIPALLAVTYIWALAAGTPGAEGGGFDSLAAVIIILSEPHAMLAGWIHYLVFDLFVGAWEVRDARRRGIVHWYILPCLFFTFMLGPIGLLMYLVLRLVLKRTRTLDEGSRDEGVGMEASG